MQLHLPSDPQPPNENAISIVSFRDFYAFEEHVKTCRAKRGLEMIPQWYEQPVFYFSNSQSLVHNGTDIFAPQGSEELDYELELGIVIGKPGRNIAVEDAWDHIAGFTIINDFSAWGPPKERTLRLRLDLIWLVSNRCGIELMPRIELIFR